MGNVLQVIKRVYFWVVCPLIIVIAGVFWFLGIGGLSKQKVKNLGLINALFTSVDSVKTKPEYANANVQQGMEQLIAKRRSEVSEAWTRKYEQQTADKIGILKWPEANDFPEDDRAQAAKLLSMVKDLRPIEKKVSFPAPKELVLTLTQKQLYQEHLKRQLPQLAEAIGSQWMATSDPSGAQSFGREVGPPSSGRENGPGMSADGSSPMMSPEDAIVFWNPNDQTQLVQSHFTWSNAASNFRSDRGMAPPGSGGYSPMATGAAGDGRPPELLDILYAQEDFWVLQALMKVIARTNQGATGRFNAAIKEIEFIRFGQAAIPSFGRVDSSMAALDPTALAEGAAGMESRGMPTVGPPGSMASGPPVGRDSMGGENRGREYGNGPGSGGEGEQLAGGPMTPDPAWGRYVDSSYKALDPTVLRKVMTTPAEAAAEEHYLAVAKRIPVRMRVKVDQKKLYNFLVECANSELTIEVRQLRVNPDDTGATGGGMFEQFTGPPGGTGMPIGPPRREGPGESRGYPGMGGNGTGMGMPGDQTASIDEHSRTDVTVEVYGIIYIYNPVDKVILKEPAPEAVAKG